MTNAVPYLCVFPHCWNITICGTVEFSAQGWYALIMTDPQNTLNDALESAKEAISKGALAATELGLNLLTPERVESLDNLELAAKLREGMEKGAAKLREKTAEPK